MLRGGARRSEARAAITAVAALLACILTAGASTAQGETAAERAVPSSGWTRALQPGLARRDVGLSASASDIAFARRVLARKAGALGLHNSRLRLDRRLRLPAEQGGATIRELRFQQTAGPLRLVWSQVDVSIVNGKVSSIMATVVPARPRLAKTERRVDRKRALRIAKRAVNGRDRALAPLAAAYAGTPTTRRRAERRPARRVWVVEVQRRDRSRDIQANLCIAVDAATGKVIGRWPGMADRPDRGPNARGRTLGAPPDSGARRDPRDNASYVLMVKDGTLDPDPIDAPPYAVFVTADDPRVSSNWPFYIDARLPSADPGTVSMDAATANTANVARTICVVRGWCGGEGAFQPDAIFVKPWLVVANTTGAARASRADRATLDVRLGSQSIARGNGDPNVPANDIVAHEFGHVMDWVYAGDRSADKSAPQSFEVEEGLADMFAYEYDRGDALIGEDTQGGTRIDMADPGSIDLGGQPYPDHLDDYDRTPPLDADDQPDYHYNGTILSHAYYLLVQRIGHAKAGRVLHNVPSLLSPKPFFREVAWAFYLRALQIYGVAASADARAAFTQVGLPPSPQFPG
jgi:Thermolysin metallopeptidase, alpha-helical domain